MLKFEYIAYGLLAITAILIVFNLVKGAIRGLKKTVASLVAIVASAIIAAIITMIACTPTSPLMMMVIDFVNNSMNLGEIHELFEIAEIEETLTYYITMVVAPFFFVAVYAVLSVILAIAASIACMFIPPHEKPSPKAHRLGGLGVGAACGLIVSMIVLMPIVGVIDIAATAGETLLQDDAEAAEAVKAVGEGSDMVQFVKDASSNGVMAVYRVGCGWMFDLTASANFEGERVFLKNDVAAIISIWPNITSISEDMSEIGESQVEALDGLVQGIENSSLLKHTMAGIMSEMAGKWLEGESFMGVPKISTGELIDPMFDSIIEVLATTTRETVNEDLRVMTDMFGILVDNGMLSNVEDYDYMLTKLGKEGVIEDLIIVVNANERMDSVSNEITRLSIRALTISLDIPSNSQELYDDIMTDFVSAVNDSRYSEDERKQVVAESIYQSFEDHGMEITNDEAVTVAEALISDLGNVSDLKNSDVESFFLVYSASAPAHDTAYSANGSAYAGLSSGTTIAVNSDGTISVGDRVLDPSIYNTTNYASSAAFIMGQSGQSIGDAAYLYSADKTAEQSCVVTLDTILAHVSNYSECSDPDAEAHKISEVFAVAAELFAGGGIKGKSHEELISDMGILLDKMGETQIFGKQSRSYVMTAILQSETVKEEMGLSVSEANTFANKLNNLVNDEYTYADATGTVSSTITMMNSVKDDNITKEERRENTQKLIEDLDPDKADMLSSMVTPSSMMKYGSSEEKAQSVSDSVSELFSNMANFNADPGSEAYQSEANAVNTVLDLAMKGSDKEDERRLFNAGGETGKLESSADDFVSVLVESEVVSATIISAANKGEENPYGIEPTDKDREDLTVAIESYYAANSEGKSEQELKELKTRLNAVAVVTDMPPVYDVN